MKSKQQKTRRIWRNIRIPLLFTIMFTILDALTFIGTISMFRILKSLDIPLNGHGRQVSALIFTIISLIAGAILSFISMRILLKPVNQYIDGLDKIANGDYTVKIHVQKLPIYRELSKHFNMMVSELNSVEMLSNDFINNFSHEFKTPIVSIKGFANMLKRDDLTEKERDEYLNIIIKESERLTDLSTSVLMLSKIEQQSILTDIERVNISEQIRVVISIISSKWEQKNINFSLTKEEDEDMFSNGNRQMLKQIWINILDNAVKFSPNCGNVEVSAEQTDSKYIITFSNECENISDSTISHIFDKFYQGDTSHKVKGNGLGLSIAQKIVLLHGGNITAKKDNEKVLIIVELNIG